METVMLPDQSISAYNRSRNYTTHVNGFAYRRFSGNPSHGSLVNIHGSLFGVPPSLSSSLSSLSPSLSSSSSFSSQQKQKQPPLLPLPPVKIQALPSPPPPTKSRKIGKTVKKQSLGLKKAKSVSFNLQKESSQSTMIKDFSITDRLGPDPSDLPKEVPKVIKSSSLKVSSVDEFEEFSDLIFYLSPPPSSLPLPKFSLRPKSRCNAQAGGADNGASDNLRRLLHLQ